MPCPQWLQRFSPFHLLNGHRLLGAVVWRISFPYHVTCALTRAKGWLRSAPMS